MHEKRKKSRHDSAAGSAPPCPLLVALREYGLLENVLSCLCPDDLLALLLCSKSIYQTLVPQPGSLENLLGKLRCSGKGVRIRRERHVKSSFFYAYECSEYVECGAIDGVAESRPCTNCKVTTCNECRIHCVYQSIFEKPCEDDELPNYSGFILLSPSEIPILSPHHLKDNLTTPQWQAPSPATSAPYHDQGFIDVPLEEESFGPPECVDDFLNLNLGTCTFAGPVASNKEENAGFAIIIFPQAYQSNERIFQFTSASAAFAVVFSTDGSVYDVTKTKKRLYIIHMLTMWRIAVAGQRMSGRYACGVSVRSRSLTLKRHSRTQKTALVSALLKSCGPKAE
ncbi:hypothetical protein GGP41_001265 [Bipolaris sorokiniana]|uniref:F-box domain-containing protein n=1 Tax=Cochliobolus sativus TaxID=45130 RepID=A0A8H5Z9Q2_COCSA|nr:hypothetical protein GGP41_001265 [Bipolaris sorokiniana]